MIRNLRCIAATIVILAWMLPHSLQADGPWTVDSPDGRTSVKLQLADLSATADYPAGERLYYQIERGEKAGPRTVVLPWSPLGITRKDQAFEQDLVLVLSKHIETIDETYRLVHGKRRVCRNHARQRVVGFSNEAGGRMEIVVRVYDDGVALRYRFPERDTTVRTVTAEATGFRLPADARAWMMPYDEPTQYTPAYENYYQHEIPVGTASSTAAGWALPALFRLDGGRHWLLLAEAAVDGSYCGCRLEKQAPQGIYHIRFPDPGEGNSVGEVEPSSTLPWSTPWRVILVADDLRGIVESSLITHLNPPAAVAETDWIKPGRAAWSWWSDHDSPRDYQKQCRFIDLAAEMGWEYYLVDANWTLMDGGDVRRMARYAESKGVGLFLWYNSGGAHNYVTEKPRGCLALPQVRRFEFELLKKWGIKGLKVDFFQSDKQNIMAYYHDILRDAAEHKLMINFHGCTIPRGWSRTWPHLMTMEAVRGAESYTFSPEYPQRAPQQNTIVPFTRNVVGPADYTPCAFSDDRYPHLTTNPHELALSVVFETGLLHFADGVDAYRKLPAAPKQFLGRLPVVWDDIRLLDGEPGKRVILARRHGAAWCVGGINGVNAPQQSVVSFTFLPPGRYAATLIGDGKQPRDFDVKHWTLDAGEKTEVTMQAYGGFVMRLEPLPTQ
ncbi:MAG: glycoside hydrolase family 97 catalytic domain-containing protein [Pirellulales bacterium]|nr:glycoside hydrolase family 97 catalytic domain-containing protein [Pirellulales bacterium]